MRTSSIREHGISFYEWVPFSNHTKTQYRERLVKSYNIDSMRIKKLLAFLWKWFGLGVL